LIYLHTSKTCFKLQQNYFTNSSFAKERNDSDPAIFYKLNLYFSASLLCFPSWLWPLLLPNMHLLHHPSTDQPLFQHQSTSQHPHLLQFMPLLLHRPMELLQFTLMFLQRMTTPMLLLMIIVV
jgi:hypothetical protein